MTYPTTPVGELTARERRALSLYAQGIKQKAIADMMHISVHTVVNHLDRAQKHLLLNDRRALKAYAKQHGLDKIEPETTHYGTCGQCDRTAILSSAGVCEGCVMQAVIEEASA